MIRALFSFQINKILLISWQFWLDRQEIEGWAQMGSAGPKVSMKVSMGFHQGAGVMGLPGAQMSSEVSMDFTAIRFSGVRKVAKAELQFTHDAIRALECSAGKSEQIFYDKIPAHQKRYMLKQLQKKQEQQLKDKLKFE